ncbi:Remodeling and spacing factor 1 [Schistosoma japonicum]|nr:Remodeling and spacing factor 1 [Schistosoma japonicum]KAH8852825.1 Remodeling and spacing factor 1 [Schistosoma japonicum]KAH8852826.1 Remodeling and spacing factor 1 [Schistosoma japonicum]KAH8852827.1 Remodeling and spacing factor 1 [Schistosoma japonicum]KAH8852829.1 Remodeling and spacing factor 1 [Schistosoma japonicum]
MRDLIEELKGAFSEDEKLESVFKKKRVTSDKSNLKDHLANLIQDDIASPELQISKNDENSTISPELSSNEDFKLTATPLLTSTCYQKPAIHSVDMLLAFSKPEDSIKTESQENVGLDEIVSGNEGKVNRNVDEVQAFEVEPKCSGANEECQIKPECTTELVLKPDDNYNEYMDRNTESLAVGQYTPILSNNEPKKSRKHNSNKSCFENASNEQDLRRSSRQRKPVQVFNIQPTQSKRSKLPTLVTDSTVNNENDKPRKQKIPIVKIHLAANGHVIDKSQKRKKKRHRKKPRKGSNPWAYGTSSSDSDAEDDSFEKVLMQHLSVDSDDSNSRSRKKAGKHINSEWSDAPESDFDPSGLDIQSDADSVTDGRNLARQKRLQKKFESNSSTHCNVDEKEEPCQICFKSHLPDWILLCDRCDLGHHAMCLSPPLHVIPEGDWFCPRCQHTALISALNETITVLETESKKRNIWKRMQERLNFVNISMTNILGDDDSDCTKRKNKKGKTLRNTQKDNVKYAYDDLCSDDENKAMVPVSHSDEESGNSNTDSGVDGKSHGNPNKDHRFRHKSLVQTSRPRRVKFREESSEESVSESDSEPLPYRNTRQRQVKYKISEAFKELDEALEADEKYQEEKQRKQKRKASGNFNQVDAENDIDDSELNGHTPKRSHGKDLSNILGPDWKEFEVDTLKSHQKKRRISDLSSSSSSELSDEDIVSGKTRRNSRTKDEDFKPSSSEVSESEDDIESRKYISSDEFEQASSDNSWLATTRRNSRSLRGNPRKKKQSNYFRRSRKPVPYFEDSDEDSDRAALRTRRCTRAVVSYRESNDDSENGSSEAPITSRCSIRRVLDDDEEADVKMDKTNANRSPTPLSLNLKAKSAHSKRTLLKSSSDSDYQPFDNDDDQEDDSQGNDERQSKEVHTKPIPKIISIKTKTIAESQPDNSNHQHSTPELIISETSDIDNSLFKDSTKSISFETVDCKIESANNIVTNSFTKSVDYLNGNNYDNDEEVEDEADECLPARNLQSHLSPNFHKQIPETKPCISPDIF